MGSQLTYFAQDGNYGSPDGMAIVNTYWFTDNDWEEIDDSPDWMRPALAEQIALKRFRENENRQHRQIALKRFHENKNRQYRMEQESA